MNGTKGMPKKSESTAQLVQRIKKDLSHPGLQASSVAILTKEEFDEIKKEAMTVTKEEKEQRERFESQEKEKLTLKEKERRDRMKRAMERKEKKVDDMNEFEREDEENRLKMRDYARQSMINNLDEVKQMNQMV